MLIEHRLTVYAADQGIPVPLPLLAGEAPCVRVAGQWVQLYPGVEGWPGGPGEGDAFALGEMHATLHTALAGFDDAELPRKGSGAAWDSEASIQVLSRVDDLIRYYPSPGAEQLRIQDTLRLQLELLESRASRPASDFADLRAQPCHGHYHNRNVLFGADGAIVAVVDWEIANILPPVYEILRALSFSGYLDRPLLEAYLRGYASHRRLSAEECWPGVEVWWQSRIHSHRAYHKRFIQGDRRVDRFFAEDDALLRRFCDRPYREWLVGEMTATMAR